MEEVVIKNPTTVTVCYYAMYVHNTPTNQYKYCDAYYRAEELIPEIDTDRYRGRSTE